jgi:hypothetical protein
MKYLAYIFKTIASGCLTLFLFVWIDHCQCEGKVTRGIRDTFVIQQDANK